MVKVPLTISSCDIVVYYQNEIINYSTYILLNLLIFKIVEHFFIIKTDK